MYILQRFIFTLIAIISQKIQNVCLFGKQNNICWSINKFVIQLCLSKQWKYTINVNICILVVISNSDSILIY